jgi:predicted signal transduction protein with EAL and GGDEF domain
VQHRDIAIALRVGIGTRIAPAQGASTDTLLEQAELALREARRGGARSALVYSEDLAIAVQERRALEKRLIAASLAEDGFQVHYQPICHAADGRPWGYEALVRLPAGDGLPAVSPDLFIPVAERLGLIPAIGRRVIRAAIAEAARWPDGIVVSINLSALQFAADVADDLLAVTREALATYGLAPSRLVYEITEGRHLQAAPEVLADLQTLKEMGVGLALDDFGTGYSTLAYLWAFPFDKLKIDASFVRALANGDGHAHTVLATVIRLGHALGLMVTAEGVETEHQAQYLRLLGCDLLQGYLYGRPNTADATEAELARRMPAPVSIPVVAKRAAAG